MMLSFAMTIVAGLSGKVMNLILQSNDMNFTIMENKLTLQFN
jgi:hypothetical protein